MSRKGGSTSGFFANFIVGKDKSMVKFSFWGVLALESAWSDEQALPTKDTVVG